MKRIVTIIMVLTIGTAIKVSAQDPIMSKKGTPIVYEAGDWGLGIDANPFLHYFGNIFNGNTDNTAPTWNYPGQPLVISGFMINDVNSAYRAKVGINFGSNKQVYMTDNDLDTAGTSQVEDEQKISSNSITLGLGIQKMRGKGRVKGMYGAEAMIGFGGSKTTNTYGNAMTLTNPNPTTGIPGQPQPGGARETERKNGSTFMIGVRGFIGVEYFFAPKISIAGEFGWGPALSSTGEGEVTSESVTTNSSGVSSVTTTTSKIGKNSSFNLGVDNNSGSLRVAFYF